MTFDEFFAFLRAAGYQVHLKKHLSYRTGARTVQCPQYPEGYKSAVVYGRGILGAFCEPNGQSYTQIDGKFAADNKRCFDKWSVCPLVLPFPAGPVQERELLAMLRRLGSPEGLRHSRTFAYLDDRWYDYSSASGASRD